MSVEWPEIIVAGAACATLGGATFAWMYTRIEKVKESLESAVRSDEAVHAELYDRINNTRETYVPKADFEKDVNRLESRFNDGMRDLSAQIQSVGNTVSARIDSLLAQLSRHGASQ